MTVAAPQRQPASPPALRQGPLRRGRLVPLVVLAALTALLSTGLWSLVRLTSSETGTAPVRMAGLSLVLSIVYLVVPPGVLAVAARRSAWFAHWASGSIAGLGVWFAFGALSPSLALAAAAGAAFALPVRYPLHRVVRAGALLVPGVFTWLVVGGGNFAGFSILTIGAVIGAPLYLVLFDLMTWDLPRILMRQFDVTGVPDAMDRIEAERVVRQVAWQGWSILGLIVGSTLVVLWWGGGRAPHANAYTMVPFQISPTDTWLDVNGDYRVSWSRIQNARGDAQTVRIFAAGSRQARMSVTNTGNPLLGSLYFDTAYGAVFSKNEVSLNALGTPTVVRSEVVDAERLDCTAFSEGVCGEFVYTALIDQYLIEVAMVRQANLKVGQLAPLVDQALDQALGRLQR